MEKLQSIAEHYGIDMNRHEENKEQHERLAKEL
jgi:hypothetical protein